MIAELVSRPDMCYMIIPQLRDSVTWLYTTGNYQYKINPLSAHDYSCSI